MAGELPKTPFGTTDRIHINNLSMMHMHIYVYKLYSAVGIHTISNTELSSTIQMILTFLII